MANQLPCSLRLLLILVGELVGLLAISASGDEVNVAFVLAQPALYGQVFKIVGDGSELSNWTTHGLPGIFGFTVWRLFGVNHVATPATQILAALDGHAQKHRTT